MLYFLNFESYINCVATMKYLNFLLILTTFLCYTGICSDFANSHTQPNMKSCHSNKQDNLSGYKTIPYSYKNSDTIKYKIHMCQDALPNAPLSHDFDLTNLLLCSLAINLPTLEINDVPGFPFSLEIKEHHPPDLFLSNSSFLL